MLAHHLRHQPAISEIKRILTNDEIGDVLSVYAQWGFQLNPQDKNAQWKLKPELGGNGTLGEQGIHLVDLFLYLFGRPEKILGHSFSHSFKTIRDNETIAFLYPDKTLVANCSQNMPLAGNHLFIYGTKGNIEVYGGIGVKNIQSIVVTTAEKGRLEIPYDPNDNFYRQEVEDFFGYYFDHNKEANPGTTLKEAIWALELIEESRKDS